jgi:hypothetical protein
MNMMRYKAFVSIVLALAMLFTGLAFAQKKPVAQRLSDQAYQKIVAAQQANEWDMDGHAQKAKELLDQVNRELKQAAEAANKNAR